MYRPWCSQGAPWNASEQSGFPTQIREKRKEKEKKRDREKREDKEKIQPKWAPSPNPTRRHREHPPKSTKAGQHHQTYCN
uniref:Uncharacterized protein n=1 Tax=Mustela putorius furo TaxID=9669 RepID=M3Y576_MUSPF